MPHYVTTDAANNITGLYTDEAGYAQPPAGAQQITEPDANILRSGFACYQLVSGVVVKSFSALKTLACAKIDAVAEQVRLRYCTSALLAEEYKMAYSDAVAWLGNQTAPVPASVQVWATAKNWTALQAANDIKTAGDGMNAKLVSIREARLNGKVAVTNCANDEIAIGAARDAAIATLMAL